jgi:hypothetical protein
VPVGPTTKIHCFRHREASDEPYQHRLVEQQPHYFCTGICATNEVRASIGQWFDYIYQDAGGFTLRAGHIFSKHHIDCRVHLTHFIKDEKASSWWSNNKVFTAFVYALLNAHWQIDHDLHRLCALQDILAEPH